MAVIDVFAYNGEREMLELHLNILNDYVDKFIIVEANKTFTGKDKPLYFFRQQRYFKDFWKKIDYYVVNDWDNVALWNQAIASPNTRGADHWKREFYIKEHIQFALKHNRLDDTDTVFIGDVDEIIDPMAEFESDEPIKAKLRVYTYYLNNRSNEEFYGTLVAQYGDVKDACLNHMRSSPRLYAKGPEIGWHFTSMGGVDAVEKKLGDSYTAESYLTPQVQQALEGNIKNRIDFLGRDITFKLDETEWPAFLTKHRKDYKHLLCRA